MLGCVAEVLAWEWDWILWALAAAAAADAATGPLGSVSPCLAAEAGSAVEGDCWRWKRPFKEEARGPVLADRLRGLTSPACPSPEASPAVSN